MEIEFCFLSLAYYILEEEFLDKNKLEEVIYKINNEITNSEDLIKIFLKFR